MKKYDDRRSEPRHPLSAPAQLTFGDRSCRGLVVDISLNGVMIEVPDGFDGLPGETLNVAIMIDEQRLSAQLRLIYYQGPRIGCELHDIADVDFALWVKLIDRLESR